MKVGETWKSKKVYGPTVKVIIVGIKDDRVKYEMRIPNEPSLDGDSWRWQFLSLYEKDYDESR